MRSESPITEQNIHHAVELYFAHAETDEDLTVSKFADFMGIPRSAVSRLLLPHQWKVLRESWRKIRLSQAIDAVYTEANTQQDFTIQLVSERAGIQRSIVYRLAQDELQARKAMLPTGKEKLTSALKTLLDS